MAFGDYNIGSTGAGVGDLQKYLREVGYNVSVDSMYGPATQAAVRAFQQARGIRVDGIAGPETLVELSRARAEGWRAPVPVTSSGQPYPYAPGQGPAAGTVSTGSASKWNGLWILLAIAVGAWYLTQKKSGGGESRRFARIERDDEDASPNTDGEEADEDEDGEED